MSVGCVACWIADVEIDRLRALLAAVLADCTCAAAAGDPCAE